MDRNGNQITFTSSTGVFTDTLGTTALTVAGAAPNPITYTYTTSTGGSAQYKVVYGTYTVQTHFGCGTVLDYGGTTGLSTSLVREIDLPDGSTYVFNYESTLGGVPGAVTGRLKSVTLPTGGTFTYTYLGGDPSHNGITCADGSAVGVTRQTPDGTWSYTRTQISGSHWQTKMTAPSTDDTILDFQKDGANSSTNNFYETQRQVYQGAAGGTLIQTTSTCYNGASAPCTATSIATPIRQRSVVANLPASAMQSQHVDFYNSYGMNTEADDYDYGTSGPGPLLRKVVVTYANLGTYLNAFAQTVTICNGTGTSTSCNGAGTPVARTDTAYDQYSSFTGSNCITGAPQHNDASYGCMFTARGNATSVIRYTDPVTPGGGITKSFVYDSLGNLRTAQVNCCQLKTWNYSNTTAYAYPDSIVSGNSAPQLTASFTYDLNMGLILTATDPNNVKATFAYDSLGRTTSTQVGSLPAATAVYSDYNNSSSFTPWTSQMCSPVQGTSMACQKMILDNQGRPTTVQLLDGSGTLYSATDTQYDNFGRAYKASNPYTGSTAYWTQIAFDVVGRPNKTTLPDGSFTTNTYTDNTILTSDPTGKQRKSVLDGLGRLTSMYEPDPNNSNLLTLQTTYAYNGLDELTGVTQGSQTRAFVYDALGRITSATTPEAGTVCFGTLSGSTCQPNGYDSFDNLLYGTDARGVQANYIYDSLNRLLGISYSNVPGSVSPMPNVCATTGSSSNNANVCFTYGTSAASYNNGRLLSMVDPSGSESYTYDQYGNTTQVAKIIGSTAYTTSYLYNLANQLTQLTYPSGRIMQQNVDGIGRPSSVVGTLNSVNTTYASAFLYNVAQQLLGFQYGNNIYASLGYSADRLQMTCLDYSTTNRNGTCAHDSATRFGLNYSYGNAGSNNGQIGSVTDAVDSGRTATYSYDALYRISAAVTSGSTNYPKWALSWTYDRYGNMTNQTQTAGNPPYYNVLVNATTNQLSGSPFAYDAGGNLTNDGLNIIVYDGENRAVSSKNGSSTGTYSYDGNGGRVKRVSVVNGVTTTTVYVFSGSRVIAEYDNGAAVNAPSREYIYGTTLLAKIDSSGTKYYHRDHLSNRLVTDSSGNIVSQLGHYPFGESWYNASNDKLIFTTYERDAESGNDYAMARTYVNRLGRFSSPDRHSGSVFDPQSLNRYSYVLNDPLNLVDPFGLDSCDDTSDPESCGGDSGGGGGDGGGGVGTDGGGEGTNTGNGGVGGNPNGPTGNPQQDCGASACTCTYKGGTFVGCVPLDCNSPTVACVGDGPSSLPPLTITYIAAGSPQGGGGSGTSSFLNNFLSLDICIKNNAKNFSIGGVVNLFSNKELPGSGLLDNSVTSTALFLSGQAGLLDTASGAGKLGWDASKTLNKPIMTNGSNSFTSLTPQRGSPQRVLGNGTNYRVSLLGKVTKALGAAKGVVDVALSGALVADCLLGQVK